MAPTVSLSKEVFHWGAGLAGAEVVAVGPEMQEEKIPAKQNKMRALKRILLAMSVSLGG